MAICIGRFGLSVIEAKRLTPSDFKLLHKAYEVRMEEQTFRSAMQAWFNQKAKAVKKNGKSAYNDFSDFYNHENEFYGIFGKKPPVKTTTLADLNLKLSKRGG